MVLPACERSERWDVAQDRVGDWGPTVTTSGDTHLVSWQERTSAGRAVVEIIREDGSRRIASADNSQIALSGDPGIAAYSSMGLVDASVQAGVVRVRLEDPGNEDRLTLDPHLGPAVPDDRPWPTLFITSDNRILWLAMGEVRQDGHLEYVLVRHDENGGFDILARFTEVSMMTMAPDRRTVALSANTVKGAPRSLFFIDSVTGDVREHMHRLGVGSFSLTGDNEGFATVGKRSRSAADRTADDVIDRELRGGGRVVRFTGDTTQDLRLSLDGQSPDLLVASPNGNLLGVVAWRGEGRKRSSNLWLVQTGSLAERNLTPTARVAGEPASFSPGGSYLAYEADDRLFRYEVATGSTRDVFGERGEAASGRTRSVAWATGEGLLCFANIDGAGERGRLALWLSLPDSERFIAARPASWGG